MKFDVLTLFPEMFEPIKQSIIGRAIDNNLLEINITNIRDFSTDKHLKVDDTPYGGGAGMLIKPDVVYDAYNSVMQKISQVGSTKIKSLYVTPQGKKLTQSMVKEFSQYDNIIILCGHYEGIDQRAIDIIQPEEVSIGDYVLTGGEIPAMVLIDSISRYVPGVIKDESTAEESFSTNLLEYPQYTRPEIFMNIRVPEVLLSGHHKNINKWRREQSLINTYNKRPELLNEANLTEEDKKFIEELSNKK